MPPPEMVSFSLVRTADGFGLGIDDEGFITGASKPAAEALETAGAPVPATAPGEKPASAADASNSAKVVQVDGTAVSNLADILK